MSDLATKMNELAREWRAQAEYVRLRPEDVADEVLAETLESCARQLDEWVLRSMRKAAE